MCQLLSEFLTISAKRKQSNVIPCADFLINSNILILFLKTFFYVEEAEWAMEVLKATGKPVAMCLNICLAGDFEGVPVEECAVRIAKAGNFEIVF